MLFREQIMIIKPYKRFLIISLLSFLVFSSYSFSPTGSPDELYHLENLPMLRPGVSCRMFSSYDRSGGNDDGFQGTYSRIREENGNSVIAEMEGAGCIRRIWFTHSLFRQDGLLDRNSEHIMIYLDGNEDPCVDVPLESIFSGELEQFPSPLVGSAIGGFYCYVPIPYRNGCKVVIEGDGVRFYHLTYTEFPSPQGIETFSMDSSPERETSLQKAVKAWSNPGNLSEMGVSDLLTLEKKIDLEEGASFSIPFPSGSYMVRGIRFRTQEPEKAMKANISMYWDQEDTPAVDIPLAFLFAQKFSPEPFQSLLCGRKNGEYYNFTPMPYLWDAEFRIAAKEPFTGTLYFDLQETKLPTHGFGYFHAIYKEELPTEEGLNYIFLNTKGKGHYMGLYLATYGEHAGPVWLEGDEQFITDGELVIHGTGSEDYFNCGWYDVENRLNQPGALPLHGFPVYDNGEESVTACAYRWHVSDPVPFQKSIEAKIEHGPHNDVNADYRSSVFFYMETPEKVESRDVLPTGDEAIRYVAARLWQFAMNDPEYGLQMIGSLSEIAERRHNRILLSGAEEYLLGVLDPEEKHLNNLRASLEEMENMIRERPKDIFYEHAEIEISDDEDMPVPQPVSVARDTLKRASIDLQRRVMYERGINPGDEIIVESRDPGGNVTPEPFYKETSDFTNSTAKVRDVHLIGKGARFTYGGAENSWARFIPDFPVTGKYEVMVIFSYGANAGDVCYEIHHEKGMDVVNMDQRGRPGTENRNNDQWISLGTCNFKKGINPDEGSVKLIVPPLKDKPHPDHEFRAYSDSARFIFRGK